MPRRVAGRSARSTARISGSRVAALERQDAR